MKILILTSYTGGQKCQPHNRITPEDLKPRAHYRQRVKELTDYSKYAGEMFTGPLHRELRAGLRQIRRHEQYGQTTIDQYFPSSYYRVDLGEDLVHENDKIVPFDIKPLSGTGKYREETAHFDRVQALIKRYDLVFSLLEKYHFLPLQRLFRSQCEATLVLLVAPSWNIQSPESLSSTHIVHVGADLVGRLDRASRHNLRGAVFRKLCEAACKEGFHVFEQVKQDPQQLLEIVLK